MNELKEKSIICPYCGETIMVLLDISVPQQSYIEDCQVCCRPINFNVNMAQDGGISVFVSSENE